MVPVPPEPERNWSGIVLRIYQASEVTLLTSPIYTAHNRRPFPTLLIFTFLPMSPPRPWMVSCASLSAVDAYARVRTLMAQQPCALMSSLFASLFLVLFVLFFLPSFWLPLSPWLLQSGALRRKIPFSSSSQLASFSISILCIFPILLFIFHSLTCSLLLFFPLFLPCSIYSSSQTTLNSHLNFFPCSSKISTSPSVYKETHSREGVKIPSVRWLHISCMSFPS